jgi:hypothetical protein
MKFRVLALLIILIGLLSSCNNDDDNSLSQEGINGSWNLKNVTGGFIGVNIDYNQGDVIWTFNCQNNSLVVENNIITTGPEDIYAGLDTGSYSYIIEQNGDVETLFIDGNERGNIELQNNILKIDDGIIADGFITLFEK